MKQGYLCLNLPFQSSPSANFNWYYPQIILLLLLTSILKWTLFSTHRTCWISSSCLDVYLCLILCLLSIIKIHGNLNGLSCWIIHLATVYIKCVVVAHLQVNQVRSIDLNTSYHTCSSNKSSAIGIKHIKYILDIFNLTAWHSWSLVLMWIEVRFSYLFGMWSVHI